MESKFDSIRTAALGFSLAAVTCMTQVHAAQDLAADRPGGADHALIKRYEGSILYLYGDQRVGVGRHFELANGKPAERSSEGKVSNRIYFGPTEHTALEVFRNYQVALRQAGFETVYQCDEAQCKRDQIQEKMVRWVQGAYWSGNGASDAYAIRIFEYKPGFHYLHARKQGPNGPVSVQVALRTGETSGPSKGRVQQYVQVLEPATIELGKVVVDAQAIGTALRRDGRIALYGILFDTNLAVIKPESSPALEQMAQALKDDAALNVYIVGHTDNQGVLDANMALSRKRAEAVVDALRNRHGIAAARLQAYGVASLAPAASNSAEDGRAINRRVEMVVR